jgi:hypothetical protein
MLFLAAAVAAHGAFVVIVFGREAFVANAGEEQDLALARLGGRASRRSDQSFLKSNHVCHARLQSFETDELATISPCPSFHEEGLAQNRICFDPGDICAVLIPSVTSDLAVARLSRCHRRNIYTGIGDQIITRFAMKTWHS